ncbi:MAG: glycoside hydrolase family 88 protein [Bacteroidales bacterium]|nr:glycoside hydrolase family 88 protein [Bacteroidales bacterium]
MNSKLKFVLLLLIFFVFLSCKSKTGGEADNISTQNDTIVSESLPWSQRMAETLMADYPHLIDMDGEEGGLKWVYTNGLVALAFQKLYLATNDEKYYQYVKEYADEIIDSNGIIANYRISEYNIDHINAGKILFLLYDKEKDERYKVAADSQRKQLDGHPRTKSNGFWHKRIYPYQMWLDGLYMGSPFYAQYIEEFGDPKEFADVIHQFTLLESKARDPKTGLLYHAWDESKQQKWCDPETGMASQFWGRGLGWYAMALTDILDYIPANYPGRDSVIAIINRLAVAIAKVQDEETGTWWQVLNYPNREGNYLEGSATAMFIYFYLKAIKNGYIDKDTYMPIAEKAYKGMIEHLIKVEPDGRIIITPVCAGAGLGGNPYRDGTYEYYINERKRDNDPKATGPFIMASIMYEEMTN